MIIVFHRIVEYTPTSLERSYKLELHSDIDLELTLVDKHKYINNYNKHINIVDERLYHKDDTGLHDNKYVFIHFYCIYSNFGIFFFLNFLNKMFIIYYLMIYKKKKKNFNVCL